MLSVKNFEFQIPETKLFFFFLLALEVSHIVSEPIHPIPLFSWHLLLLPSSDHAMNPKACNREEAQWDEPSSSSLCGTLLNISKCHLPMIVLGWSELTEREEENTPGF